MRWLGHFQIMEDGLFPKDILYGKMASDRRTTGHPQMRYKDVFKRDMKALESWEGLAADRRRWRSNLNQHLKTGEEKMINAAADSKADSQDN